MTYTIENARTGKTTQKDFVSDEEIEEFIEKFNLHNGQTCVVKNAFTQTIKII
jgi:hypothetical protein